MSVTYKLLSSKLIQQITYFSDGHFQIRYNHWCPACKEIHQFAVEQPFNNGAKWTWNNDPVRPHFSPSMNITCGPWFKDNEDTVGTVEVCHYFLHHGILRYLSDCTHEFAGKEIELPEIPKHILLSSNLWRKDD